MLASSMTMGGLGKQIPFGHFSNFGIAVTVIAFAAAMSITRTSGLSNLWISIGIASSVTSFRTLRGFSTTNGCCSFAVSLCTLLFPVIFKCILAQPADSCLRDPDTTYFTIALGMLALSIASYLSVKVHTPKNLIRIGETKTELRRMANFCIGAYISLLLIDLFLPTIAKLSFWQGLMGSAASLPLAATAFEMLITLSKSDGRSAVSARVALLVVIAIIPAIYGFWRQGIFAPGILYFALRVGIRRLPNLLEGTLVTLFFTILGVVVIPASSLGHNFSAERYPGSP